MSNPVEIHGFVGCPFAWRTRIAATLKGVPFEWLPCDAPSPDPRTQLRNPARRSPLLYDDDYALTLVESGVIAAYLDESREGPALQPSSPKERALARLAIAELAPLQIHGKLDEIPAPMRQKAEDTAALLEKRLSDGRAFVDGDEPGLVDVHVWPGLATMASKNVSIPEPLAKSRAYWERSRAHPAFTSTKPPWA